MWGIPEAVLGWFSSQVVGLFAVLGVAIAGSWSLGLIERPGGHLGRAVGQLAAGNELRDDMLPLFWRMATLAPGWIALLGVSWAFAAVLGRDRPGWSLKGEWSDVGIGVVAGVLLQIPLIPALYVVIQLIVGELEPTGRALGLVDQIGGPFDVIMLYAFVAVGAPIVEELFYRGLVQRSLVERFGPYIGIGAASLIFGLVHFSLFELPALTLVGLILGLLAWRADRLLPAVVAHMVFNAWTLTILVAIA